MSEPKERLGFTCECGKRHIFGVYVMAHWDIRLEHTCECGAKHSLIRGVVRLVKQKRGVRIVNEWPVRKGQVKA